MGSTGKGSRLRDVKGLCFTTCAAEKRAEKVEAKNWEMLQWNEREMCGRAKVTSG